MFAYIYWFILDIWGTEMTALSVLKLASIQHTNKLMIKKFEDGNVMVSIEGKDKNNERKGMFMVITPAQINILKEFIK